MWKHPQMTANITSVELFNILRQKIGEVEAKALTDYVESTVDRRSEADKKELATKGDLKEEIHKMELKIESVKSELSKTIYIVGLVQFLAIVGSVIGIVSFMLR